jgi:alkanesulfonate monooxygenase SsuD/methylene tetrahydromethanopterin reductase-like flavin-dependent oxidoreductase (luciferase family)
MKLGVLLDAPTGALEIDGLVAQALQAEAAGIETVWVGSGPGQDTALITAAALASRTSVLRLAACVAVGGHPLEVAESAAVADNCSNGRLILVLQDVADDAELLAETVDVILAALSPRPFRHEGVRWRIPANLPENDQPEERIVVTPSVVQTELPVWMMGPAAAVVARERGLPRVSDAEERPDAAESAWTATETALGPAARRLRRPALRAVAADQAGAFDDDELVARLRAEQRAWGLDTAILRLPTQLDDRARAHAVRRIATRVRPRVVMHELPAGLEGHWKEVLV